MSELNAAGRKMDSHILTRRRRNSCSNSSSSSYLPLLCNRSCSNPKESPSVNDLNHHHDHHDHHHHHHHHRNESSFTISDSVCCHQLITPTRCQLIEECSISSATEHNDSKAAAAAASRPLARGFNNSKDCPATAARTKNRTQLARQSEGSARRTKHALGRAGRPLLAAQLWAPLLALACLVLLATDCRATARLLSPDDGDSNEAGEDFYSTTTALSTAQIQPIPFSAIQSQNNNNNNKNNNISSSSSSNTDEGWARKRAVTTTRAPAPVEVSESELLPFSDFIIQPAAFGDLMKSWPPTTLRARAKELADSLSNRQRQQQQRQQQQQQQQRQHNNPNSPQHHNHHHHQQQQQQKKQPQQESQQQELSSLLMRNHLNEDLDDSIVTADQSFERDHTPEPETWINYLGDLGDYIYLQLKHHLEKTTTIAGQRTTSGRVDKSSSGNKLDSAGGSESGQQRTQQRQQQQQQQPLKLEAIDELLDDYYYDQYENSQVLYYGAQLVREQDSFEIGCFLPIDQRAEWTKSGKPLPATSEASPRTIKRTLFLHAKQNYTLKVFTASLSDSGNYRCSKMSRKFHKVIVVPESASPTQVYAIQKRLLSIVSPDKLSSSESKIYQFKRAPARQASLAKLASNQLYPGYLIVESEPLVINCNISDVFVLQRLRENPQFRLAWYKNGKQLPGSRIVPAQAGLVLPSSSSSSGANNNNNNNNINNNNNNFDANQARGGPTAATGRHAAPSSIGRPTTAHQRVQFLDPNGRRLFIAAAQYSDAGEYLCSWSNLPARQMPSSPDGSEDESSELLSIHNGSGQQQQPQQLVGASSNEPALQALSRNPLAAGSLSQLIAPVKLRPFKSTYHVRRGDQLRLVCQVQRGHPQAQLNWYVGNRLVDAQFLKERAGEFKILYLQNQNQLGSLAGGAGQAAPASDARASAPASAGQTGNKRPKIVEINPIPVGKLQMQLTQDGRWIEYRDFDDEKSAIETSDQQLKYMQQRLARLTGINVSSGQPQPPRGADYAESLATYNQMSISVLVIESLDMDRHSMRYACRATNRANTDEVTTVIRVQASSTVASRPSSGRATLITGQNLNFQCTSSLTNEPQFWWFRRKINESEDRILLPDEDEHFEIHNDRMTLVNPTPDMIGDYSCKQITIDEYNATHLHSDEVAIIRVRTQPMIDDFGIKTSHTGKSSTIDEGSRLVLTCSVYDKETPVNITWLRSMTPDDEKSMAPLREQELELQTTTDRPPDYYERRRLHDDEFTIHYPTTFISKNQHGIRIESLGTHLKRLVIDSVGQEHRSYYACVADNGVTERTKRIIFIRVQDRLVALWPFLGILAELFILFTIIKVWETQRFSYRHSFNDPPVAAAASTGGGGGARAITNSSRSAGKKQIGAGR